MINLSSPVTGAAVTGLTGTVNYTVASDQPPNSYSKQWYVTASGVTNVGADVASSASRPWTFTFTKPSVLKSLNSVDNTGVLRQVGFNTYDYLMRKGITPLAGQASRVMNWRTSFPILVGSDTADALNLRTATAAYIGVLSQQAPGLVDTFISGSL